MLEIKFTEITNNLPKVAKTRVTLYDDVYIYATPFLNCQMFSIGGVNKLLIRDDEFISEFIKKCKDYTGKKQMCIDVTRVESKFIIDKLRPHIEEINSMEYINNNETKMVIHVIKLK